MGYGLQAGDVVSVIGRERPFAALKRKSNTDLITAFAKPEELTGEERFTGASKHAKDFVLSMYDVEVGCFYQRPLDGI
ncbi:MAG TPA: hypothetical protein DEB24_00600 [Coriobacteriia bacterium]|nr:hypothetical protein [Coriobacteriia bacterium]